MKESENLIPLGVWGGTFDMPTNSHKQFILDALELVNILYVVPCGKQESKQPEAMPWERVAMIGLVTAEILSEHPEFEGRVRVWTGEIEDASRENKTIETVEAIENLLNMTGKAVIFIGEDLVESFPNWERPGERAVFVRERKGFADVELRSYMQRMGVKRHNGGSRKVRERIRDKKRFTHLVPQAVGGLIKERGLYGYRDGRNKYVTIPE